MLQATLQSFAAIGAETDIATRGRGFEIDIRRREGRELFQLTCSDFETIETEVLDVRPKLRHLVLDVSGAHLPISGRFLCGHDERHWFVAGLPLERATATVHGAMEALKPDAVRREQKRKGVKHRLHRRHTAAYVRQGEWFFLPRPMMHVGELAIRNGRLTRPGGKPHRAEWLYQPAGTGETFVRGAISHPDHATIRLQVWHRVVQNAEVRPEPVEPAQRRWQQQSLIRSAYFD